MADVLGEDYSLVEKNALYRCLDKLLAHKAALFDHLRARWQDLFGAEFEVLLYDLTSAYFESDPPDNDADKRRHGYSRDKRSDCVQVVIALIVTPEGLPLADEVLPGNTANALLARPWQAVRQGVDVKRLAQEEELCVLARSSARVAKERAMRRRKLKWLWARLKELSAMSLIHEELLMKLGAARAKAPAAWRIVDVDTANRQVRLCGQPQ